MPTLIEFNSILDNVNFAKNNNLRFIELNMDLPYCLNIKEGELLNYDMEFTMHISEKINVAELNDNLRKLYLNEAIRQIELGISNNIKKFNIHIDSGVYFTMPDGKFFLNEKYQDIYEANLNKSCKLLNDIAKEYNIKINFENTKIQKFTGVAIKIINNYKNLGFTLDIGHNEKNKNKAFPLLNETNKIRHIHLHDFDGNNDHLTIGKGIIDFTKYHNVLKDNYIVIEVKQAFELEESIKYLRNLA